MLWLSTHQAKYLLEFGIQNNILTGSTYILSDPVIHFSETISFLVLSHWAKRKLLMFLDVRGRNVIGSSVLIPELHHCCVIDLLLLERSPMAPTALFSIHPFISDEEWCVPFSFSYHVFVNTQSHILMFLLLNSFSVHFSTLNFKYFW